MLHCTATLLGSQPSLPISSTPPVALKEFSKIKFWFMFMVFLITPGIEVRWMLTN
ncbi:unnamed protein product [Ectocarpus sp. CCAP 1310/34]|nr:unnamed protein product [Ectocarpus sp. CCAP 1310/34]